MRWKVEQNRHLARMRQARQASRQASRLWKLPLMQWKVEQNRHLARMAGLEAGLEAMEMVNGKWSKTDTWLGGGKPQGRPRGRPRGYGNCSKGETWLG